MDKAKAAVSDFLSKSGRHDTTVHENVAPAVQHETVNTQKHENVTTAVDREIHQDHYHTSVQPIQDREVLGEKHHHNIVGVEHRTHEHDDPSKTKEFLERERAKFQNTTTTGQTQHTQSAAATVSGEHTHHHVHENIQPVIEKETIQPHVVHTTVPIHEVHNNAAQHHTTSALPAMTMKEFTSKGGELGGRGERYDAFEGEPRAIGGGMTGGSHSSGTPGTTGTTDTMGTSGTRGTTGTTGRSGGTDGLNSSNTPRNTDTTSGLSGKHHHADSGVGDQTRGDYAGDANTTSDASRTNTKPSLMDKLNPKVDANGDGKPGFMK